MLQTLYRQLADLYELEAAHDITEFISTDRALTESLRSISAKKAINEQLLVQEQSGHLNITLFFDESVLQNLKLSGDASAFSPNEINNYWLIIEGISHFLYLTWRGQYDRTITQLEMELQAEIDKFICTSLLLPREHRQWFLYNLHQVLFEKTSIDCQQSTENPERYFVANRYAAKYCYALTPQLHHGMHPDLINGLRRFYRLSQSEKIRHINSLQ